jgi:hypothetical protein
MVHSRRQKACALPWELTVKEEKCQQSIGNPRIPHSGAFQRGLLRLKKRGRRRARQRNMMFNIACLLLEDEPRDALPVKEAHPDASSPNDHNHQQNPWNPR